MHNIQTYVYLEETILNLFTTINLNLSKPIRNTLTELIVCLLENNKAHISKLGDKYLEDIKKNSVMLAREQKQTGVTETQSFIINKSKPIINEIDKKLAHHYQLTDEEVDFLINYDIKFRMSL